MRYLNLSLNIIVIAYFTWQVTISDVNNWLDIGALITWVMILGLDIEKGFGISATR